MALQLPNDTEEIRKLAEKIKLNILINCNCATISDEYCMDLAFWQIYGEIIAQAK